MYGKAYELLRPYEHSHEHAVVIVDADLGRQPGADAIREHRRAHGCRVEGVAVIVIEPELEAWLMNKNGHLARIFRCPENYREILAAGTCGPPIRPSHRALRRHWST